MKKLNFKVEHLVDIEIEGVDLRDYPDFCDAFVSSAAIETQDGEYRELTDEELDILNDAYPEIAQELAHENMH